MVVRPWGFLWIGRLALCSITVKVLGSRMGRGRGVRQGGLVRLFGGRPWLGWMGLSDLAL